MTLTTAQTAFASRKSWNGAPKARRKRTTTGRAALVVALCLGCTDRTDAPHDVTPGIDEALVLESVVGVAVRGCGGGNRSGVGTVIDESGLIVTAAHVVAGASAIEVTAVGEAPVIAEVVYFDPDLDLAALQPHRSIGRPADVRIAGPVRGEPGIVVTPSDDAGAAPRIIDIEVVRPVTIRTTDIYLEADVERPGFEIDATIEPGDSGAMVQLAGGGAGIVWARSTVRDDHAWAVNLPAALTDPASRAELTTPVDPGRCPP